MGRINSRTKGSVGEREWAQFLNDRGFEARRGIQFSGSADSPDVITNLPDWHCECKRTETLSLYKAMDQATKDAGASKMPFVAHRRNKRPWLTVVYAEDFVKLVGCQKVVEEMTGLRLKDLNSISILASLGQLKKRIIPGTERKTASASGAEAT